MCGLFICVQFSYLSFNNTVNAVRYGTYEVINNLVMIA